MVRLQAEAIPLEQVSEEARSDADGAVVLFVGTVRNHNKGRKVLYLEYEAYPEMAVAEMQKIEQEALTRFAVSRVVLVHRTGRLEIGEASVVVAVASAHRADALDACRFVIDTLKARVPIWKKEVFEGGEVWIEGAGESPAGSPLPDGDQA
jgi:molybdopterin synthase catalytic subunit